MDLGIAQKTRPALVLSVAYGDTDRVAVTVVSHTTSLRDSPFEMIVPVPFPPEGAFDVQSITTIPGIIAAMFAWTHPRSTPPANGRNT
ncbi:MAG TPA: hypothetical protein VF593_14045 [Chthoniobacteraceae bacterium]